jgi:L-amino acid N-acyltransferase YncA
MPPTPLAPTLRDATEADLPAITAVYAENVLHGTGTFETEPPEATEMARRRADVLAAGLPWLVAEQGQRVLGYAYANTFRPRAAYRFCVEDSVYLARDSVGMGLGKRLLEALIARCEAAGSRQMIAVIGDSANAASIAVHRACGFTDTGVMRAAGWKFGRWLDVVLMQRALGDGHGSAPSDRR